MFCCLVKQSSIVTHCLAGSMLPASSELSNIYAPITCMFIEKLNTSRGSTTVFLEIYDPLDHLLQEQIFLDRPHALAVFNCVQLYSISAESHGACCCMVFTCHPSFSSPSETGGEPDATRYVPHSVPQVCVNWMCHLICVIADEAM